MSTYGYSVEQIRNAVHVLATGDSDLRSRLHDSIHYVLFAPPTDLPSEMAETLRSLQREIEDLVAEGSIQDLQQYAERLVALHDLMHRDIHIHDS